jgi:hypothetical protein
MKITYRQTGGFAGISKACKLDIDTLDLSEQDKVKELVEKGGFLKERSVSRVNRFARDTFNYKIFIENDGGKHEWELDDLTVNEVHLPLIKFLRSKAVIARHS